MINEKSCGAVIFNIENGTRKYFLIFNKKGNAKGHWGFPKGHTEAGENEYETASREIYEETGLRVVFYGDERVVTHYSPKPGIEKDVVYFLAIPRNNQAVTIQKEEAADYRWCTFSEAMELLTFDGKILEKIENLFTKNNKIV